MEIFVVVSQENFSSGRFLLIERYLLITSLSVTECTVLIEVNNISSRMDGGGTLSAWSRCSSCVTCLMT